MHIKTLIIISLLSGLFFLSSDNLFAQRSSLKIRYAERKNEVKEWIDRRKYEKEKRKRLQEHFNRQTPEVQERMKQNMKEDRRRNRPIRPPFYKRWFIKKPKKYGRVFREFYLSADYYCDFSIKHAKKETVADCI
jgi:hypothetical protein